MKFRPDREWPGLIALAVLYIFLALAVPRFFAAENLRDLALSNVSVLLVAMGMTLVIVVARDRYFGRIAVRRGEYRVRISGKGRNTDFAAGRAWR